MLIRYLPGHVIIPIIKNTYRVLVDKVCVCVSESEGNRNMVQRDGVAEIAERMKALKELVLDTASDNYRLGTEAHMEFLIAWQEMYYATCELLRGL